VIVLGEYRYGLKRSKECALRERWLDELELNFDVLEVSSKTAKHYAQIREELRRNGTPIPENDIWISAIVREHEIELLSKDRHFDVVRGLSRKEW
jgi:predicted nucleic acid-binding protein